MANRELDVRGTKLVVVDSIFGVCRAPVAVEPQAVPLFEHVRWHRSLMIGL